jgi:hypothetical protein
MDGGNDFSMFSRVIWNEFNGLDKKIALGTFPGPCLFIKPSQRSLAPNEN